MIIFQTPGTIDINAVTTLGVSVKTDSAIGYFGTGLKFAIAVLLRNGAEISIYTDSGIYIFDTQPTDIRGQHFDIVTLNGSPLGFTTQLGRDWELWMAFRELACNTLDESGAYGRIILYQDSLRLADTTNIVVTLPAFDAVFADREKFLITRKPIVSNDLIALHTVLEPAAVHYKSVKVGMLNKPSIYTYDLKEKLKLTEDRTYAEEFQLRMAISRAVGQLTDPNIIERILTAPSDYYESQLSFYSHHAQCQQFIDKALELANRKVKINSTALELLKTLALYKETHEPFLLTTIEQQKLNRAQQILLSAGFDISQYKIVITESLGLGIHGQVKDNTIYLSRLPFTKGTREVAATLLEEYAHLSSGAADCTREFQNYFIDQLLTQIETNAAEAFYMQTFYAITDRKTGAYLPAFTGNKGATWVEFSTMLPPRLFRRKQDADLALKHWLQGKISHVVNYNLCADYDDYTVNIIPRDNTQHDPAVTAVIITQC